MNNNGKITLSSILLILLTIVIAIFAFSTYLYFTRNNTDEKDTKKITNNESVLLDIIENGFNTKLRNAKYYINENNNNIMYDITKKYSGNIDSFLYFIPSFVNMEDSLNVGNATYTEFQCVHPACDNETKLEEFFKEELSMSNKYLKSYIYKIKADGLIYKKSNLMYVKNIAFSETDKNQEKLSKSFVSNDVIYLVLDGYYTSSTSVDYYKIFKFITEGKNLRVDGYYINKAK